MHPIAAVGLAGAMLCVSLVAAQIARGPNRLQSDVVDMAEVAALFGDSVAVTDIDEDRILDCLTARKTQYDPEEWSVTYLWSVEGSTGERLHFPLHAWATDKPDLFNFTTGLRPGYIFVGRAHYFDHESCVIVTMRPLGDQCTLWVTKEHVGSIPDLCLAHYADICGAGVDLHTKSICKEVDQSAFL